MIFKVEYISFDIFRRFHGDSLAQSISRYNFLTVENKKKKNDASHRSLQVR